MSAIVNDRDVLLQAAGTRLEGVALPTSITVPVAQISGLGALATQAVVTWATQVTGSGKPADNADVTTAILTNSATAIVMTASQLFKSSNGVGGVFLGAGGLLGKNSSGVTTFSINATTGAVFYGGDITGNSNVSILGQALFNGSSTVGTFNAAVQANISSGGSIGSATNGIVAYSSTSLGSAVVGFASGAAVAGVRGNSSVSGGIGVLGEGPPSGAAVQGTAGASGVGVQAQGFSVGSIALLSDGPQALVGTNTFTWNGLAIPAPTGSATKFLRNDATWADLTNIIKVVSTANPAAGAAQGYLVIDTYGSAGQVKIPYFAL